MTGSEPKRKGLFGRLFGGSEPVTPPAEALPPADSADEGLRDAAEVEVSLDDDTAGAERLEQDAHEVDAQDFDKSALEAAESAVASAAEPSPKLGWFQRLKSGLGKTSGRLTDGITGLFTKKKLDGTTLEDLEDLLIQADLGTATAQRITSAISKGRYEKGISADDVRSILALEVQAVLEPVAKPLLIDATRKPHVIMMVGVNGTGKTTTIGKLASTYVKAGHKVVLAAGDTFRAAAIDQLKVWGERSGCEVVARGVGADSSGLAYDALKLAIDSGADVLLLDTAGRLQNKQVLMEELEKVTRVLKKLDAEAPHDVVLVLDATTGQNALNQVEVFRDRAGVTGLVMTKLDGTARGGILVAISARFGLPVHAIGIGEGIDDLQAFSAADFAAAIADA